jgi:TonB family protein
VAAQEYRAAGGLQVGSRGLEPPVVTRVVLPESADGPDGAPYREVEVEGVVQKDGRLRVVRTLVSVDRSRGGLDAQAIQAIRQWEFQPGHRNGRPEAVRLVCVVGFGDRRTLQQERPAGAAGTDDDSLAPGVVRAFGTPGVVPPVIRVRHDPPFTTAVLRLRQPREVEMEIVVLPDGRVGPVRIVRSLQPEADALALAAARATLFEPATRDGQPIPVRLRLVSSFISR